MNLYVPPMPPIKFPLYPTYDLRGDVILRISRWPDLGYRNRTILAILNRYVTMMPPIKFRLNLIYSLGGYVVWRISRRPSWISEQNNFSNSESLCHCDASNQVLAKSNLRFGRRCGLKNFKVAAILVIGLIVLGFNNMSTLVGHFVSSPREKEKRNRRYSRGEERKGQLGKKEEHEWKWRNRRNKNIPPLPLPATKIAGLAHL